jgi:hypothetical protein
MIHAVFVPSNVDPAALRDWFRVLLRKLVPEVEISEERITSSSNGLAA